MSLHDRIAGLAGKRKFEFTYEQEGYLAACKDAAQIAREADDLMAEMAKCLEDVFMISIDQRSGKCGVRISDLLAKYYSLEERKNELN